MLDKMTGPIAVFSGATTDTVTRDVTAIDIVEAAVFEELVPMFPVTGIGESDMTDPTYPALFRLLNIKSFKLTSGTILVAFRV